MRATYRRRPGWTKAHEGRWDYHATGYSVRHCGHPTALWPYYGETPEGQMISPRAAGASPRSTTPRPLLRRRPSASLDGLAAATK